MFLTSIKAQITQERIKSHQRSDCLVFLSFKEFQSERDEGKWNAQLFLYWFTQS